MAESVFMRRAKSSNVTQPKSDGKTPEGSVFMRRSKSSDITQKYTPSAKTADGAIYGPFKEETQVSTPSDTPVVNKEVATPFKSSFLDILPITFGDTNAIKIKIEERRDKDTVYNQSLSPEQKKGIIYSEISSAISRGNATDDSGNLKEGVITKAQKKFIENDTVFSKSNKAVEAINALAPAFDMAKKEYEAVNQSEKVEVQASKDTGWSYNSKASVFQNAFKNSFGGMSVQDFEKTLELAKKGDKASVDKITEVYNAHADEFSKWRYGKGINDVADVALTGEVSNGVFNNISAKRRYDYTENRTTGQTIEDNISALVRGAADVALSTAEVLSEYAVRPVLEAPLKLIGADGAIEYGRNHGNIKKTADDFHTYTETLNELDVSTGNTISSTAGTLAGYIAVGYYSGIMGTANRAGSAVSTAISRNLLKSVASEAVASSYGKLFGLATELVVEGVPLSAVQSAQDGSNFFTNLRNDLLLGAGLYGAFKALKYTYKTAGYISGKTIDTVAAVPKASKWAADKVFTKEQQASITKTASKYTKRAEEALISAGVSPKKAASSVAKFVNQAKELFDFDRYKYSISNKIERSVDKWDNLISNNKRLSNKEIDSIKYASTNNLNIDDFMKPDDPLVSLAGYVDSIKSSISSSKSGFKDTGLDISDHQILDTVDIDISRMLYSMSKGGARPKNAISISDWKEAIDDMTDGVWKTNAMNAFKSASDNLNIINTPDKDKLFFESIGNAQKYDELPARMVLFKDVSPNKRTIDRVNQRNSMLLSKVDIKQLKSNKALISAFDEIDKVNSKFSTEVNSNFATAVSKLTTLDSINKLSNEEFLSKLDNIIKELETQKSYIGYNDLATAVTSRKHLESSRFLEEIDPYISELGTLIRELGKKEMTEEVSHITFHIIENINTTKNFTPDLTKVVKYDNNLHYVISESDGMSSIVGKNGRVEVRNDLLSPPSQSELDYVARAVHSVERISTARDNILKNFGLIDEELMMSDIYLKSSLVRTDGSKFSSIDTNIIKDKIHSEYNGMISKINPVAGAAKGFKSGSAPKKRNFKTAADRDAWIRELFDDGSVDYVPPYKTNTDSFAVIRNSLNGIQRDVKNIGIAESFRTLSIFSNRTHIVYDKEMFTRFYNNAVDEIQSFTKSFKNAIDFNDVEIGKYANTDYSDIDTYLSGLSSDFFKKAGVDTSEIDNIFKKNGVTHETVDLFHKFIKANDKNLKALKDSATITNTVFGNLKIKIDEMLNTPDGVKHLNTIKSLLKEIEDVFVKSDDDVSFSVDSDLLSEIGKKLYDIEGVMSKLDNTLSFTLPSEMSDIIKKSIGKKLDEIKADYGIRKQIHVDKMKSLELKGYKSMGDILGDVRFNDIMIHPDEAEGLIRISERMKDGVFKDIVRAVQFQKQIVASSDFFLTGKTALAVTSLAPTSFEGVKVIGKTIASNVKAVGASMKAVANSNDGNTIKELSKVFRGNEEFKTLFSKWSNILGMQHIDYSLLYESFDDVTRALEDVKAGKFDPASAITTNKDIIKAINSAKVAGKWTKESLVNFAKNMETLQFNYMLPFAKMRISEVLFNDLISGYRKSGKPFSEELIRQDIGRMADRYLSSQNWDLLIAKKDGVIGRKIQRKVLDALPAFFFAPDFLFTKFSQSVGTVIDATTDFSSVRGTISRRFLVRTLAREFTMMQMLSLAFNGDYTWNNPNGKFWMLKTPLFNDENENLYINPLGFFGQAIPAMLDSQNALANNLSIPLKFATSFIFPDMREQLLDKSLGEQAIGMLVPMSLGGLVSWGVEGLTDANLADSTGTDIKGFTTMATKTILDMFGLEGRYLSDDETRLMISDVFKTWDSGDVRSAMSKWQIVLKAITTTKEPTLLEAVTGETGSKAYLTMAENPEMFPKYINAKYNATIDKAAYGNAIAGTAVKVDLTEDFNNIVAAMTSKYVEQGVSREEAISLSVQRIEAMSIPNLGAVNLKPENVSKSIDKFVLGADSINSESYKALQKKYSEDYLYHNVIMENPTEYQEFLQLTQNQYGISKKTYEEMIRRQEELHNKYKEQTSNK